jgi:hypothetical protein
MAFALPLLSRLRAMLLPTIAAIPVFITANDNIMSVATVRGNSMQVGLPATGQGLSAACQ